MKFKDFYLEEITEAEITKTAPSNSDDTVKKLLETIIGEKPQKSDVQKLSQDFKIEKFDGTISNVCQWINECEKE